MHDGLWLFQGAAQAHGTFLIELSPASWGRTGDEWQKLVISQKTSLHTHVKCSLGSPGTSRGDSEGAGGLIVANGAQQ